MGDKHIDAAVISVLKSFEDLDDIHKYVLMSTATGMTARNLKDNIPYDSTTIRKGKAELREATGITSDYLLQASAIALGLIMGKNFDYPDAEFRITGIDEFIVERRGKGFNNAEIAEILDSYSEKDVKVAVTDIIQVLGLSNEDVFQAYATWTVLRDRTEHFKEIYKPFNEDYLRRSA